MEIPGLTSAATRAADPRRALLVWGAIAAVAAGTAIHAAWAAAEGDASPQLPPPPDDQPVSGHGGGRLATWQEQGEPAPLDTYPTDPNEVAADQPASTALRPDTFQMNSTPHDGSEAQAVPADPSSADGLTEIDLPEQTEPANDAAAIDYSVATVAGKRYHLDENSPPELREYLTRWFSNLAYESFDHLMGSAVKTLANADAMARLVAEIEAERNDPQSAVFKQSAHIGRTEFRMWDTPHPNQPSRDHLLTQVMDPTLIPEGSKLHDVFYTPEMQRAFDMMIAGREGPFTLEQMKDGFTFTIGGQILSRAVDEPLFNERHAYKLANELRANRLGTHCTWSPTGAVLSHDIVASICEENGLPVMGGTSGTSAEVMLATLFNTERLGESWVAPGLTEEDARWAMVKLAVHFFTSAESGLSMDIANRMNDFRGEMGLPKVDAKAGSVFTHSFPEIYLGVMLMLARAGGKTAEAVREIARQFVPEVRERFEAYADGVTEGR